MTTRRMFARLACCILCQFMLSMVLGFALSGCSDRDKNDETPKTSSATPNQTSNLSATSTTSTSVSSPAIPSHEANSRTIIPSTHMSNARIRKSTKDKIQAPAANPMAQLLQFLKNEQWENDEQFKKLAIALAEKSNSAEAVDLLATYLGSAQDSGTRISVIRALGTISTPHSVAALRPALESKDVREVEEAVGALNRIPLRESLEAVAPLLAHTDNKVTTLVANMLKDHPDMLPADTFVKQLNSSDRRVRATVLYTIDVVIADQRNQIIQRGVEDEEDLVRYQALQAAAKYEGGGLSKEKVDSLIHQAKENRIRAIGMEVAIAIQKEASLSELFKQYDARGHSDLELGFALGARHRPFEDANSVLAALLDSQSPSVRSTAIQVLASIQDVQTIPLLKKSAFDAHYPTAYIALDALAERGAHGLDKEFDHVQAISPKNNGTRMMRLFGVLQPERAKAIATAVINEGEAKEKLVIATTLERYPIEIAIELSQMMSSDSSQGLRYQVVRYLANHVDRNEACALLEKLATDKVYMVALEAKDALTQSGGAKDTQ